MSDFGREILSALEVDMPFCAKEHGTTNAAGTCNAQLGPDGEGVGSPLILNTGNCKCYNTRKTCQDPENYLPETKVVRFSHPQRGLLQYDNIIPSMSLKEDNPKTTPGAINLGSMDRNLSALGAREIVDIDLDDHRWNDHQFDKYRLERISGDASLEKIGVATAGSMTSLTLQDNVDKALGRQLRIVGGAGASQRRTVVTFTDDKVAIVSPRWATQRFKWTGDFTNAVWGVGDADNPKIPNSTDIAAPDGTFSACKWVLNDIIGNRSFGHSGADAIPAVPGQTIVFSFWVYIPSSNSAGFFQGAYAFATGEIPAQQNIHAMVQRNTWTRISFIHTWGAGASGNVNAQFHGNSSDTIGDRMYVWRPQLEIYNEVGEYIQTTSAHIVPPSSTSQYEVRDAFDPKERGSFWGKFLARNPYYANYRARVLRGFMGQPLSELRTRHYIIDRITGPNSNGRVRMVLKDLFSLIEARKSVAPIASQGELSANITGSPGTFSVLPVGIGNTPTAEGGYASITNVIQGHVAIGDEIIRVTRVGDTFTILERGALDTVSENHDDEDLVQLVLSFEADLAHDIIYALLTEFSGIPAAEIPKAEWDILAESMPEQYTARIAEPTPVRDLLGELCEQAGCTLWHSPETGLIQFVPLRPKSASVTFTDREFVNKGFEVKRQDDKRVSRVLVYYGQKNPLEAVDDRRNYRSRAIIPDLDSEGPQQFGVPALREVFGRWMPQFGRPQALATGQRILALFRNPPLEARFNLSAMEDGQLSLAQPFLLQAFETQSSTGEEEAVLLAPVQLARGDVEITVRAQGIEFFVEPGDPNDREIFLDSTNMRNLNMRTVHDTIYSAPVGTETVTFILPDGFFIGSTNAAVAALRTGSWPVGVVLSFINQGRVQGKAGLGRAGGSGGGAGSSGQAGGTALLVEFAITVNNTAGELWGGGGGGGGGGSQSESGTGFYAGGGGGGGGAGLDPGNGGAAGVNNGTPIQNPGNGGAGTESAGGGGGQRGIVFGFAGFGSNRPTGGGGGGGGGIGIAGGPGGPGFSNIAFSGTSGAGGSGGAAGKYVQGNSLVTWAGNGDRRGGVS